MSLAMIPGFIPQAPTAATASSSVQYFGPLHGGVRYIKYAYSSGGRRHDSLSGGLYTRPYGNRVAAFSRG